MSRWSTKIADTVLIRTPLFNTKWNYDDGVVFKNIEHLYKVTKDEKYFHYIKNNLDAFINDDGSINLYDKQEYNIDHINNGKTLMFLYNKTGDEKYRKAADLLYSQIRNHPRIDTGVFWHKQIYPHQVWLDGIYMASPFYCEYLKEFAENKDFDDVTKQIILTEKYTKDKVTGLLFHGYDHSRQQSWADNETGHSPSFWSRAIGWYVMAICDVLDYLPKEHKDRNELMAILDRTLEDVLKYQDKTGAWFNITDKGLEPTNYLESSASAMFTYGMAKGILNNYLDRNKYEEPLKKAYNALIEQFVTENAQGFVNFHKTISGAGLGITPERDGLYPYYVMVPIVSNDTKALGAFIGASLYYEEIYNIK